MELKDVLKLGYEEYIEMPKGKVGFGVPETIYSNGWCVIIGKSFISPHPHRHYTFEEFVEKSSVDIKLCDRFVKKHL